MTSTLFNKFNPWEKPGQLEANMVEENFETDPKKRFSRTVEYYAKYRPGYPREVIPFLQQHANFSSQFTIADVGSGTGISSEVFLKNGNEVYGVEPNDDMRRVSESLRNVYANFHPVAGSAEDTTLKAESIDLITIAQAFHWFNVKTARQEFQRILKSNGSVLILWNHRKVDPSGFSKDYEDFIWKFAVDYGKVKQTDIRFEVLERFFGHDQFTRAVLPNAQSLNLESLRGRVLSSSYMPQKGHPHFEEMLENLDQIFRRYSVDGSISMEYDTEVYWGRFR
jgi:ubiquinone/menaquinone biosynthesis C-methylase UbiE